MILVTGGAGFIGSHLVDALSEKHNNVRVIDNLSSGLYRNLSKSAEKIDFIKGNLLTHDLKPVLRNIETVYHFAANPEIRLSYASPETQFTQNIKATFNLLESIRNHGSIETFVFTSSSTVYGEPKVIPTPEDYSPLHPISVYGATKLAGESLISSYSELYGFNSVVFRLANIIGSRSNHGVIYDFIKKLTDNPDNLEVLGDGTQIKSYLHVSDCITGILKGVKSAEHVLEVYNLGSTDKISVLRIAEVVKQEMGLQEAEIMLTGGVDGGRGWKGDVKIMQLDCRKLLERGWTPHYSSEIAVKRTAKEIFENINMH